MKTTDRVAFILVACLALSLLSLGRAEERFSFDKTPGKLPKHILPRHYEITLRPDADALSVSGTETIEIEVTRESERIVLNANDLEVTSARLAGGPSLKIGTDKEEQLLTLTAEQPIPAGKHRLELVFKGKIIESASGMFFMDYTAPGGTKKRMIATQFEATDARRAFPCFDEPAFRATFSLTAEVPENFKAVSNMPVTGTEPIANGWKRVRFDRSPSMPTYLLVLVAGELDEIHDRAGRVDTHIWFTEGKQEQARYALESSKRLLAYFEKYFGVRFPLPKLDHIAMPGGFGGAMEHWGAITYNEGRILFDPRKSSQDMKEQSFGIMAHEMAHQWFGNLVTMAWWDNLWLNEGFASWMGTKATDDLNPEWNHWVRSESAKLMLMARDARKSTHPIQRPVASESQIGDAFDDITYTKGMFFIRMLEDYLGDTKFRDGLRRYMKRHAFSNTTTADLWAAMEEVSRKPVAEFAAGWTEQPGLPIIVASSHCEGGKQEIELRQDRFSLLDPTAAPLRWKVPVTALVPKLRRAPTQILVEGDPVILKLGACADPVKLNAGSRGYYRVSYDRPMFERLRANWRTLSEADRVSFLSDSWAMLETGRLSAEEYLNFLPIITEDKSVALWEQVLTTIAAINTWIQGEPFQADFQKRVIALLRPLTSRLGYEAKANENINDGLLRARLLGLIGSFGQPEFLAEARRRFEAFRKDPSSLTGDLRPVVLNTVGEHATSAEFDELVALAKKAVLEEDRQLLLDALTKARNPEMVRRTLDLSLTKDFPPVQSAELVSGVSRAGWHAGAAWNFMKQHHRDLMALVGGPFANIYAASTVAGLSDEARASDYVKFIRENYPPDALAKAEEAADQIRYAALMKRQIRPGVEKWSGATDLR